MSSPLGILKSTTEYESNNIFYLQGHLLPWHSKIIIEAYWQHSGGIAMDMQTMHAYVAHIGIICRMLDIWCPS